MCLACLELAWRAGSGHGQGGHLLRPGLLVEYCSNTWPRQDLEAYFDTALTCCAVAVRARCFPQGAEGFGMGTALPPHLRPDLGLGNAQGPGWLPKAGLVLPAEPAGSQPGSGR